MGDDLESAASAETGTPAEDRRVLRGLRAIVLIHRAFEQASRKIGVSIPQYRLLLFLRHGARRAGELAASAAVKRPTLTALVTGMEKEGWLRRVQVEGDRRGVALELTSRGGEAIEAIEASLGEMFDELCSAGDREKILDSFDEMAEIVAAGVDDRIRRYRTR